MSPENEGDGDIGTCNSERKVGRDLHIGEMTYYGTKKIQAWPEDREGQPGMAVEYEDGYRSWSPLQAFHSAYRHSGNLSFGHAIAAMKEGHRVCRAGWNGKNMWIVLMSGMSLPCFNTPGSEKKVNDRTAKWIGKNTPLETLPYFAMWTADKKWLPGWLASQSDMNGNDWMIVEGYSAEKCEPSENTVGCTSDSFPDEERSG